MIIGTRNNLYVHNVTYENADEWNEYVQRHPLATNYHQFEWRYVIERTFGHKTFYLLAKNNENSVEGVLPLVHIKSIFFGSFLISLPFFNYGGLLCTNTAAEIVLVQEAKKIMHVTKSSFIEFRHLREHGHSFITKKHKASMVLDIKKDIESQWNEFDAKLRNQVRKSEKNNLSVAVGHADMLDQFYKIFSCNMRNLGTPVYSESYFQNILRAFPNSTRVFTVSLRNRAIASGIATWHRDTIEMPWASSFAVYRSFCPNNKLYWEVIKYAIEKKFKKFDFGRSTLESGTYKYKEQWGARPVQLFWQYCIADGHSIPEINPDNPKYSFAIMLWKHLPLWLTELLGPHIARCIP